MRFNCPKKDPYRWRIRFAFNPRRIGGVCVWLEFYECRATKILYGIHDDYYEWEYRLR